MAEFNGKAEKLFLSIVIIRYYLTEFHSHVRLIFPAFLYTLLQTAST